MDKICLYQNEKKTPHLLLCFKMHSQENEKASQRPGEEFAIC
jgi:hypothetical protein